MTARVRRLLADEVLHLKDRTDNGIVGWGEPVLEGRTHTVMAAVEEMKEELIGRDPRNIEAIWTRLYRGSFYRGGPVLMSAIGGIDQALWDIKGKFYDTTVSDLLGGDAEYNAAEVRAVLSGKNGPVRDAVVLNAAGAMVAYAGLASDAKWVPAWESGLARAADILRDPQSMVNALRRIKSASSGSRIQHPDSEEVGHMFFASGLKSSFGGAFATHVEGVRVRSDGVHYSAAGVAWMAPWLVPQLVGLLGQVPP